MRRVRIALLEIRRATRSFAVTLQPAERVDGDDFSVLIIPHTLKVTTLGCLRRGDQLNLEVDMLARYAARLAEAR